MQIHKNKRPDYNIVTKILTGKQWNDALQPVKNFLARMRYIFVQFFLTLQTMSSAYLKPLGLLEELLNPKSLV